jgi:glycerophosphoryl diester phosphodiesterase
MNYTPEQIAEIVLKVLKEVETPDVSKLSFKEKIELAKNPNTPVELLQTLATYKNSSFRYWVAKNPNTPVEVLKVLATDENSDVQYWVAENPNFKKQTIELTSFQYDALKKLIESGQDESLKGLM